MYYICTYSVYGHSLRKRILVEKDKFSFLCTHRNTKWDEGRRKKEEL